MSDNPWLVKMNSQTALSLLGSARGTLRAGLYGLNLGPPEVIDLASLTRFSARYTRAVLLAQSKHTDYGTCVLA